MDYMSEYKFWCDSPVFDEETKAELRALTDQKEIEDRFYKSLSFGTGGLRGVLGAGTNRMNIYTVGKATQGLANFINSRTADGSVCIAYDSRRMSSAFALDSARILAANGIKAYLFDSLRPTPELSFAVRETGATAGIVITASHNPPQYNGYKVYWTDGGQIVPPYDSLIINEVNKIASYADIKRISAEEAASKGLLVTIGREIDEKFDNAVMGLILNKDAIEANRDMRIVYTSLHGTGNLPVRRILKKLGFENVWVVPQQAEPDGNFPTVSYPNPEDKNAFRLALELAKKVDAEIVLATDPDADRLGVYAKDKKSGEYMPFTGNMSGLLIAEYELSQRREKGLLPENTADGALVTTIVSSNMAHPIAEEYGLTLIETLTGFKYIGEQIKLFEEARKKNGGRMCAAKGAYEYEFGFEESYGCLVGTHARDKDAVTAVVCLCEAAAYYRQKGLTLWDVMLGMYKKYGCYLETLYSVTMGGADGAEKIKNIIRKLREDSPSSLGGKKVIAVRDYKDGVRRELMTGKCTPAGLPESNVLYFELEDDGWCCVRPSGTEPKIKFYCGVRGVTIEDARDMLSAVKRDMTKEVEEK